MYPLQTGCPGSDSGSRPAKRSLFSTRVKTNTGLASQPSAPGLVSNHAHKETTVRYIYLATFALTVLGIYMLTQLGTDYVTVGRGLHPALAVLGSVFLTIAGALSVRAAVRVE